MAQRVDHLEQPSLRPAGGGEAGAAVAQHHVARARLGAGVACGLRVAVREREAALVAVVVTCQRRFVGVAATFPSEHLL